MTKPERLPVRLAVFDCDGTLVDGQADVCWAMDRAFARAGLPAPDRQAVRRLVGLSLPVAVRHLAPDLAEDRAAAVTEFYRSSFRARREEGLLDEPLYDGIAELLAALHANGWSLAVATGKSDRGLAACLATHGIADLFVSLQTADRHPSKPNPAMLEAALFEAGAAAHQAVMIGDTSFDMLMARSIGVHAIGVAWGYHEASELLASGARSVADDVAALTAMMEAALP
jgi:phosphoglycolate phosphatase